MNKRQIRRLKSHYLARWSVLRHNQKHTQKILLINDLFVLKNLLPGSTLCHECLGEIYRDIIPDLATTASTQYTNLVLVNNIEFKYKTLDQITVYLEGLANTVLLPTGRVILSFEHRFLIYDRINVSINTLLTHWVAKLDKFKLISTISLLGTSQPGYGNYFFCLEYQ
jgi:hypothetical protein